MADMVVRETRVPFFVRCWLVAAVKPWETDNVIRTPLNDTASIFPTLASFPRQLDGRSLRRHILGVDLFAPIHVSPIHVSPIHVDADWVPVVECQFSRVINVCWCSSLSCHPQNLYVLSLHFCGQIMVSCSAILSTSITNSSLPTPPRMSVCILGPVILS